MRKIILCVAMVFVALFSTSSAQEIPNTLTINMAKSNVGFKAKKMAFVGVEGSFSTYSGKVALASISQHNTESIIITELSGTIVVDSVQSGNSTRDEHIRGEVLFDSKKYPEIVFTMTQYEPLGATQNGQYEGRVYGIMQAHGIAKEVVLSSHLTKGADTYTLSLNGKVDVKKDFGMESYVIMNNTVTIDVVLVLEER